MDARLGAEDVATGTVRARQIPVRQGVIETQAARRYDRSFQREIRNSIALA